MFPPLILLMRKVMKDFHYKGYSIPAGDLMCIAPGKYIVIVIIAHLIMPLSNAYVTLYILSISYL